jgi:flavin reductase
MNQNDLSSADAELLRLAMRRFASGVTVVTAQIKERQAGITVSAFTSISLDPPVVMVAINTASSAAAVILQAEHFAVHILSREQEHLSEQFSQSSSWEEKIRGAKWQAGRSGAPVIAGATTVIDCVLLSSLTIGTHTVMFGRVVDINMHPDVPHTPLLYYDRNYRTLDEQGE